MTLHRATAARLANLASPRTIALIRHPEVRAQRASKDDDRTLRGPPFAGTSGRRRRGKKSSMDARARSRYPEVYARWQRDPEGFWAEAASEIDWIEPAKKVFDPAAGIYGRWFTDAVCNTCWNALDRHVATGRGGQAALIHDS